jgi:membrane protein implicated in regulation of membrane protease activity
MAVLFWVIVALICLGVEFHTRAFMAGFLGLGAVLAFVLALVSVPFFLQAGFWIAVSVGGVWGLRPMAVRRFGRHQYEIDMTRPTHTSMTHLTGLVQEDVGNEAHPGRVKIQGELWRAVTEWPEPLRVGSKIVVDRAYGTTLWVIPQ